MKTTTSLFFIVISVATVFFYTYPNYKKIQELKNNKTVLQENLDQALELKKTKNDLVAKYKKIDPKSLDLLKKVVPENFDSVRFVGALNEIASKNGMIFSGVSVGGDSSKNTSGASSRTNVIPGQEQDMSMTTTNTVQKPTAPYVTKDISFTLSGSYTDFIKTIKDFEKSIQIVDIKSLSIGDKSTTGLKSSSASKNGALQFTLEISTYSIK